MPAVSALLDALARYNAVKQEHVPDAMRRADIETAQGMGASTIWTHLLAGTGVSFVEAAEACTQSTVAALLDLRDAGHIADQATLDLLTMVAPSGRGPNHGRSPCDP